MRNHKAYKLALAALIVLILSVSVVSAAPVGGGNGTPYCERVTFANVVIKNQPSCFVKVCAASITVKWHGLYFWHVFTGWDLRQGQRLSVKATVCSDGTAKDFSIK